MKSHKFVKKTNLSSQKSKMVLAFFLQNSFKKRNLLGTFQMFIQLCLWALTLSSCNSYATSIVSTNPKIWVLIIFWQNRKIELVKNLYFVSFPNVGWKSKFSASLHRYLEMILKNLNNKKISFQIQRKSTLLQAVSEKFRALKRWF